MYKKCIFAFFAVFALVGAAEETQLGDREVWNEGVEAYRRGDVTNALARLRPLMLSRTHGARAAEVVAKLEYERGNLEEAAFAAQIALRANPGDERVNRNFTRAVNGIPAERAAKKLEDIRRRYQGRDPGELLHTSTKEAREIMAEAENYRTNSAETAVMTAERLSQRAVKLSECWVPLQDFVAKSVTNQDHAADVAIQIEDAKSKAEKAVKLLSDVDAGAYAVLSDVEDHLTRMLKTVIPPPSAMREDLMAQSNAWNDVEAFNGRPWQHEALDYTRSFRTQFPAWAREYESRAQSDTNLPPFTAEAQAKVSALATELEKLQMECVEKELPPEQEKAIELIHQILDLLPKENNGGGGGQQQNNPQNKDDKDNKNDGKSGQPPPSDENQKKDGQKEDGKPKEPQEREEKPEDGQGDDEKKEDSEIESVLRKAQERSDEYEADKKERKRRALQRRNRNTGRDW
jgi:hypothetical protein